MHFLSASSMSPKSLHAICKDLAPPANPFRFVGLFFFFSKYSPFYVVSHFEAELSYGDIYLAFTVPSEMFYANTS